MPQGFQAWDAQGRLAVDISNRFTRLLSSFYIPHKVVAIPAETYPTTLPALVHSGVHTNAAIGANSGQLFIIPVNTIGGTMQSVPGRPAGARVTSANCAFSPPEFTFSGNNINWSYDLQNTRPVGDPSEWFVGGWQVYYGKC